MCKNRAITAYQVRLHVQGLHSKQHFYKTRFTISNAMVICILNNSDAVNIQEAVDIFLLFFLFVFFLKTSQ